MILFVVYEVFLSDLTQMTTKYEKILCEDCERISDNEDYYGCLQNIKEENFNYNSSYNSNTSEYICQCNRRDFSRLMQFTKELNSHDRNSSKTLKETLVLRHPNLPVKQMTEKYIRCHNMPDISRLVFVSKTFYYSIKILKNNLITRINVIKFIHISLKLNCFPGRFRSHT